MSVFQAFACMLNQHQPLRRDVTWNGRNYIGVCRHCDARIERIGRRRWRRRKSEDAGEGQPTPR
ncbi:hypothetical protein [Erythrobacter oryzae]|uniref:hypothetical protein n=1 Tax=Erythrobacter oryzae TaxID=3019556 RepID=UPI0025535F39|nr:hypothetical protein [Erythrobacter sp. COR-2]